MQKQTAHSLLLCTPLALLSIQPQQHLPRSHPPCDSAALASLRKCTSTVSYSSGAEGQAARMAGAYAWNTSGLLRM